MVKPNLDEYDNLDEYNKLGVNLPKYSFLFEQPWENRIPVVEVIETNTAMFDDPFQDYEDFHPNRDLISLIEVNPNLFYRLERSGELGKIPIRVKHKWSITKRRRDEIERLISVLYEIKKLKEDNQ
ncbi:MAG: hypothetical protein AABX03_01335 [Nanoarchaeota archaeon]